MGLPADNPEGYKAASVMTYVKNYRGVLRLEQGTMDDNVHLQNTLQLVSALEDAEKHFELMLYPGAAHGWYFLRGKALHGRAETKRFLDTYLLKK
jgi:dipeptidyl-peptidase-4